MVTSASNEINAFAGEPRDRTERSIYSKGVLFKQCPAAHAINVESCIGVILQVTVRLKSNFALS